MELSLDRFLSSTLPVLVGAFVPWLEHQES